MSFARLTPGHWVAGIAALVLLLAMAADWYGTVLADNLRRDERLAHTDGQEAGQAGRTLKREIPPVAESQERNAWQAYGQPGADLLVLALLLAAVALGIAAAYLQAAGVTLAGSLKPSALAAGAAAAAVLAVAFRLWVDQPGLDEATTVRGGAMLGLLALGLMTFGAARAAVAESAEESAGTEGGAPRPPTGAGEAASSGASRRRP